MSALAIKIIFFPPFLYMQTDRLWENKEYHYLVENEEFWDFEEKSHLYEDQIF